MGTRGAALGCSLVPNKTGSPRTAITGGVAGMQAPQKTGQKVQPALLLWMTRAPSEQELDQQEASCGRHIQPNKLSRHQPPRLGCKNKLVVSNELVPRMMVGPKLTVSTRAGAEGLSKPQGCKNGVRIGCRTRGGSANSELFPVVHDARGRTGMPWLCFTWGDQAT